MLSSTNVASVGCAVSVQADQHCTMQPIAAQSRSHATNLWSMCILQDCFREEYSNHNAAAKTAQVTKILAAWVFTHDSMFSQYCRKCMPFSDAQDMLLWRHETCPAT